MSADLKIIIELVLSSFAFGVGINLLIKVFRSGNG